MATEGGGLENHPDSPQVAPAVSGMEDNPLRKRNIGKDLSVDDFAVSSTRPRTTKHKRGDSMSGAIFKDEILRKVQLLKSKYDDQKYQFEEFSSLLDELLAQSQQGQRLTKQTDRESEKTKDGVLPKKHFRAQQSLLTELFEISHIQTIHYIFVAVLLVFSLSTVINDLMYHGTIGFNLTLFRYAFGKTSTVLKFWLVMQASALVGVYIAMHLWERTRSGSKRKDFIDLAFLGVYVTYQLMFLIVPAYLMVYLDLPPASAAIVVSEQIRFMMKSHAFVREKIPSIVAKSEHKAGQVLDFSRYLYFQFVPTLVYRDHYPRTKRIRWNLVLCYFANVLGAVVYAYYIFLRFCIPVFQNFNHVHVNLPTIINSVFSCILPGSLLFVIVFFALLHCWMNAFAEMLQFADRMFYKDWWNSTNFSNYYRTWNIVVHDWLYTYIYRDLNQWFGPKYRNLHMLSTFLISAVFHEYVFCCMFRFFYPVLFVMFAGVGVLLMFATQRKSSPPWNIVLWTMLLIGLGVLVSLYSMEYYARFNCPPSTDNKVLDYFIPRSWTCYMVRDGLELKTA